MRFAYADPPYLGWSSRYYGELHPDAADYDDPESHRSLVNLLSSDYDGWAMSLSSPSLRTILPMCPPDVRVAAWVKPFASFKPGVNPAYAWEPIIFRPLPRKHDRAEDTTRDWIAAKITLERGLTGAKPEDVCHWMFDLLQAHPDDDFTDLFPGSGAVGSAWESWRRQLRTVFVPVDAPDLGLTA